jgi:uncharacterized membrane protein
MLELVVAVTLFVVSHFVLAGPPVRGLLVGRLGEGPFQILYAIVAAALIAWSVVAYGAAEVVPWWGRPAWSGPLAIVVMPFAFILVVGAYTTPNVMAVRGEALARRDDPVPGIMRITRHPMMWGVALWAATHLAANGDAASAVFFGGFLVLALGGMVMIDAKRRARLGADWERIAAVTSLVPFAAILGGRTRLAWGEIGPWRVALGLAAYGFFLLAHRWVTGVPVLAD